MAGYWHTGYLLPETGFVSDELTYELDLPISHKLSALYVKLRCDRGANGGGAAFIPDIITQAVVRRNGDEELFRARGRVLERMARVYTRKQIPGYRSNVSNAETFAVFPIFFGRQPKDPHYYLDTVGASSLKLVLDMEATISATEFATGKLKLEVIAVQYMQGSPGAHAGVIKTRELEKFATAATGTKIIDIPRNYPIYRFYVYSYKSGIEDGMTIFSVKVNLNNGESIPVFAEWRELKEMNRIALDLETQECGTGIGINGTQVETWTGNCRAFNIDIMKDYAAAEDFNVVYPKSAAGGRVSLCMLLVEGSSSYAATVLESTNKIFMWQASGEGVGQIVCVPFDVMMGMDNLLKSREYSKVQLELVQNGLDGDCVVMMQEVLPR